MNEAYRYSILGLWDTKGTFQRVTNHGACATLETAKKDCERLIAEQHALGFVIFDREKGEAILLAVPPPVRVLAVYTPIKGVDE